MAYDGMYDPDFFCRYDVGHSLIELFENLPGCLFFMKDRHFRMVAYNKRLAEQVTPTDKESILGMTDHDFMPGYLADAYRLDDEHVMAGETIRDKVEMITRVERTDRFAKKVFIDWSSTTKVPVRDGGGRVVGIYGVTRPFEHAGLVGSEDHPLAPALKIMRQDFANGLKVPELAESVNLSRRAFERSFKAAFGLTPKTYMRHVRVQEASYRLIQTQDSLPAIALDCGFSDQSHLSREFTKLVGEPPKAYRDRMRSGEG